MAKRPGRPPIDRNDPESVSVHVRLPSKQYAETARQASTARMNLGDWIRRVLKEGHKPPSSS